MTSLPHANLKKVVTINCEFSLDGLMESLLSFFDKFLTLKVCMVILQDTGTTGEICVLGACTGSSVSGVQDR